MTSVDEGINVRAVAAATVVATAGVLPPFLLGALAVRIRADLQLGPRDIGIAISTFFVVATVTALRAGRWTDRLGWEHATHASGVLLITCLLGTAVAATSWVTLLAILTLGALGHAIAMPASNLALARETDSARQGLLFGLKQSAVPAGTLLAGLAVPTLALTFGWRWAFAAAAVCPLAAILTAGGATATSPTPPSREEPSLIPSMLVLTVGVAVAAAVASSIGAFLVLASVDAGMGEAAAGFLLVAASILGLCVRVGAGWLVDRRRHVGMRLVVVLLLVGAGGLTLLATGVLSLLWLGALLAYGGAWGWPGLLHHAVATGHPRNPGEATGVVQIGLSAGAAIGPALFGFAAEQFSFGAAWGAAAALAVLAGVLVTQSTGDPVVMHGE